MRKGNFSCLRRCEFVKCKHLNGMFFLSRLDDEIYFQETLFAALVIAARLEADEKTSNDLCEITIWTVQWALEHQKPDIALGICRALLKMCKRCNSERCARVLFLLGSCHFSLVSLSDICANEIGFFSNLCGD